MKQMDLGAMAWRMRRVGDVQWHQAAVPGSVYADLLAAGAMADPFYRDNEDDAMRILDDDFVYETAFDAEAALLSQEKVVLRAEGLDTLSSVTLNGKLIAQTDNMHRRYEWDVKELLQEKGNVLSVRFASPNRFIAQAHARVPVRGSKEAMDGYPHLRKAHCMFGWDWGPKLPDAGIWRPILLAGYRGARIKDVYITQSHAPDHVALDVKVAVDVFGGGAADVCVRVSSPSGEVVAESASVSGEAHIPLTIENPQLWWPNGYGAQPLYRVEVSVYSGAEEADNTTMRIGLRTMDVRFAKDEWGEGFANVVNGVAIFAMGADYIPEDNILSRVTPERSRKLLETCVAANYNIIRVWGGGYYPDSWFYDICDELGLLVWQDFMFACSVYHADEAFSQTVRQEAIDNVRRLRHHASLALWCGNNETEEGWATWDMTPCLPRHKADYLKLFEVLLPAVCAEHDPATFYWPSSPSSGGGFDDPTNPDRGDVHYWQVWHGMKPFTEYRKFHFRYVSEFGFQSFPGMKTIEAFTEPGDRNIFSYVMEKHQKNAAANGKILYYLSEMYPYPKDLDHLAYASQLLQADAIRYGVEHWRRNRGRCMGAIYWQVNDCWPVASWASIDSFGRWKALHYYAKRFYAPVMLSACEEGTGAELVLANETMHSVHARVTWALREASGAVVKEGETDVSAAALSSERAATLDFAAELTGNNVRSRYLAYDAFVEGSRVSGGTVLFCPPKHFAWEDPKLTVKVEDGAVVVTAAAFAKSVEIDCDADVVLEDNYFDMQPGSRRLAVVCGSVEQAALAQGLRARSVYDIAAKG